MGSSIVLLLLIVAVNVIATRNKMQKKQSAQRRLAPPVVHEDEEPSEPVADHLKELLRRYASDHPEETPSREISVDDINDAAFETRKAAPKGPRKKLADMTDEEFAELTEEEVERYGREDMEALDAELEKLKKPEPRKVVPDDCEMSRSVKPIAAAAPVLHDDVSKKSQKKFAAYHAPETKAADEIAEVKFDFDKVSAKPATRPAFRMTASEARRGIVLAKILEEPRFRRRWSPVRR